MPPSAVHRHGRGEPLVLVHGLGATHDCWRPVLAALARHREVVTFDLPGFGARPPLPGRFALDRLVDAVEDVLRREGLLTADLVGSSLGGEVVLELLRRGHGRHVVALAPSGYWGPWGRAWFRLVAWTAAGLVRTLRSLVPAVVGVRAVRALLLQPLSPRPHRLDDDLVVSAARHFGTTPAFLPGLRWIARRREPVRVPADRVVGRQVTLAWGRRDGLCLPSQAARAAAAVPGAAVHRFDGSGHLPAWDEPAETARLLLAVTGAAARLSAASPPSAPRRRSSADRGRTGAPSAGS